MRYLFNRSSQSPKGDNKQSAKPSYEEAGYYDIVFPQAKNQAKPIVTRATIRGLYGKVDTYGFAIVPKQTRIAEITTSTDETQEAVYIVKECFEEMADYYKQLDLRGKLSIDSKTLKEIVPKKSWVNPRLSYSAHQDGMISKFISLKDTDLPEIVDYNTFEKSFVEYARTLHEPLTMSGFCTSHLSDPRHSGLVIDISPEKYSADQKKYEAYIRDPNFKVFRSVVNRFGFRIDKNIPWRLYFDVSHTYSVRKFAKYGINNTSDFFSKCYDRIVDLEMKNLDTVMNQMYNAYYNTDQYYLETGYCSRTGTTKVKTKTRELVNLQKLNKRYDEDHWIRTYLYFRAIETGKKWSQARFDKVVTEATATNRYRSSSQMSLTTEPYFLDKTSELFHKRGLTDRNSFDTMITGFKF
jgi:hypothetical protein